MRMFLRVAIPLLVLGLGAYVYALSIPASQTLTRTITLKQTPDAVFDLLEDVENMPKWNRSLEKVELLPPIDGKPATRQTFNGKMQMTIVTSESEPPHRLVRSMGDTDGPFVGSWTYDIKPTGEGGSTVALTEQSQLKNPFFRLVVKWFGPTKYMDQHLEDMAKNFGETAVIR